MTQAKWVVRTISALVSIPIALSLLAACVPTPSHVEAPGVSQTTTVSDDELFAEMFTDEFGVTPSDDYVAKASSVGDDVNEAFALGDSPENMLREFLSGWENSGSSQADGIKVFAMIVYAYGDPALVQYLNEAN